MKLLIRYFAPFDDLSGSKQENLTVDKASITVNELIEMLSNKYSKLKAYVSTTSDEALRRHMIVAIGTRIAHLEDAVHDGDNIKILPTISGG